jgi:CelD/BcsL family acetyltransferase involved in cellulose biosynthesis
MVRRRGAFVSPSNWHSPEFATVVLDRDAETLVLRAALQQGVRRTALAFVDGDSDTASVFLQTAAAAGVHVLARPIERSFYVDVAGSWDDFKRGLSRNLRGDTSRCLRRLSELGPISLDVQEGEGRLDELLAEIFETERSGWKSEHYSAIAAHRATKRFYTAVAAWAAQRNLLRLAFLRVGARPVAFHFALEDQGVYFPLKGSFDVAFRRFSPGNLMILLTLQRAFALGLTRYEFLGSDEAYKRRWATDSHTRVLLQAFPPSALGWADWIAYAYGLPLLRRGFRFVRRGDVILTRLSEAGVEARRRSS